MANGNGARVTAVNIPTNVKTTFMTVRAPQLAGQINPGMGFNNTSGPSVAVFGSFNLTPGTGTTSATVNCIDEGGVAIDLAQQLDARAAVPDNNNFAFFDTRNDGIAHLYSIQVTQTAASGNGTVNLANAVCITTNG